MKYRITTTTAYAFPVDTPGSFIERVIKDHGNDWNKEWVRYERADSREIVYKTARTEEVDTTPPVVPNS
jgi:hypothetical protein